MRTSLVLVLLVQACAHPLADVEAPAAAPATAPAGTAPRADLAIPAAPAGRPRVDPSLSAGTVPFGDIQLQLELGTWTVEDINVLLAEAHERFAEPGARIAYLMEQFVGTPFEFESQLAIPPAGTLRIRLASFGCTAFVIYMLAMTSARTFEDFADNVRQLRYLDSETRGVDSDPTTGNIFDFAYDIFVDAAARHGLARDVTAEVAGDAGLTTFSARFTARRRTPRYDREQRLIVPRLHNNEVVDAGMITLESFTDMDRSRIQTGDILLFSKIDPTKEVGDGLLVAHMGIAMNVDGEIYMMHATRDYVWRPTATADAPPTATGIYYGDDRRREQLGVTAATLWVADPEGQMIKIDGEPFHGYSPDELRPVHDYLLGAKFRGVMVMRPIGPPV
jgi:hypothetical protein